MNKTLAEMLVRLMAERDLNPHSLSIKAGLNPTAVRDIIKGRSRRPLGGTINRLADALEVTLDDRLEMLRQADQSAPPHDPEDLLYPAVENLEDRIDLARQSRGLPPLLRPAINPDEVRRLSEKADEREAELWAKAQAMAEDTVALLQPPNPEIKKQQLAVKFFEHLSGRSQ